VGVLQGKILSLKEKICGRAFLRQVLSDHSIDAVIHFAGFNAVGELVSQPIEQYANNVQISISKRCRFNT
jgi:UDP-glucose 4-epimerase